jgi:hypothetical protein
MIAWAVYHDLECSGTYIVRRLEFGDDMLSGDVEFRARDINAVHAILAKRGLHRQWTGQWTDGLLVDSLVELWM